MMAYNHKERAREIKRKQIEYRGGRCVSCGFDNPLALDFHHRDPITKNKIVFKRKQTSFSDAVKIELDKCDIFCRCCHRIVTYGTQGRFDDMKQHLITWIGGECYICGLKEPLCCLDFHHLVNKEFEIGRRIRHGSMEKLITEVEKCILLCANHHRLYHSEEIEIADDRLVEMSLKAMEYQTFNDMTVEDFSIPRVQIPEVKPKIRILSQRKPLTFPRDYAIL